LVPQNVNKPQRVSQENSKTHEKTCCNSNYHQKGEYIMSDHDNDFGSFLTGFLVGGLVGAAVALLMAPNSGEETRTLIKDRSIELKDLAVERAEAARDRAVAAAEQARARAEELAEQARVRAEEVASTTKGKVSELQEKGRVVLEEQKDRLSHAIEAGKQAAEKKRAAFTGESETGETPA
jgi:gas vesicle protein